jgi:serine-type D-Ala-D-Ala carboxypeptidase (penicillin-binding protein 5/6)
MRLIAIVLGESSSNLRSEEVKKMLTYGFQSFETYLLYQADQELNTEQAWYGNPSQLRLGLGTPLYVTIPKNQYEQLKATIHVNKPLVAPIHKGDSCGKLTITLANDVIAERPLVALHEVQKGHFLRQFVDHLWLKFH